MLRLRDTLALLMIGFAMCSCTWLGGGDDTYQYFERIEGGAWRMDDEIFFSSASLKEGKPYNVLLVLRLDSDLKYQSIPIGITFETPQRELEVEDRIVPIESIKRGKGGYNIIEQTTMIARGVTFPNEGVYTYSIRHLSTDSVLHGIIEVGLLIEPSE